VKKSASFGLARRMQQYNGNQGESGGVQDGLSGKVSPALVSTWTKLSLQKVGILRRWLRRA